MGLLSWFKENYESDKKTQAEINAWVQKFYPSDSTAAAVINVLVKQCDLKPSSFEPEGRLIEDLQIDDATIELIMALEDKFKIHISNADAEQIATVAQLIEYIRKRSHKI